MYHCIIVLVKWSDCDKDALYIIHCFFTGREPLLISWWDSIFTKCLSGCPDCNSHFSVQIVTIHFQFLLLFRWVMWNSSLKYWWNKTHHEKSMLRIYTQFMSEKCFWKISLWKQIKIVITSLISVYIFLNMFFNF